MGDWIQAHSSRTMERNQTVNPDATPILRLDLRYVAILRDERGLAEETVDSRAATPRALYEELHARHGFSLAAARLQVAVNDEFAAWDRPLRDGDRVVFLPPVAGG
jgi:molybdopterin converting factor small subunit